MRDQPIDVPFPIAGLNEFPAYDDQTAGTSADMQNVVPVDPKTGRLRGAQRPGTTKYATDLINLGAPIQDIIHMIGPRFGSTSGPERQMTNNPSGASWGLIKKGGDEYLKGGHPTEQFEMACFDSGSNFYVATRPTTTSAFINIDKYDREGKFLGFLSSSTTLTADISANRGLIDNVRATEEQKIYVAGAAGDFPVTPFAIRVAVPGRLSDEWMWVINKTASGTGTEFRVLRGEDIAKTNSETELDGAITDITATSITVDAVLDSDGNTLFPSNGEFSILVSPGTSEEEKMTVTAVNLSTNVLTVVRSSSPQTHADDAQVITNTRTWATGLSESSVRTHKAGATVYVADRITVDANVSSTSHRPIRGMVQVGPHLYTLFNGNTTGDPFAGSPAYDCRDTVFRFNTASGSCPEGTFSVGKPKGFVHSSSTGYSAGTQEAIGTLELLEHRANLLVKSGSAIVYPSIKQIGIVTTLVLNAISPATGKNFRNSVDSEGVSTRDTDSTVAAMGHAADTITVYAMVADGVSGVFISTLNKDDSASAHSNVIYYVGATTDLASDAGLVSATADNISVNGSPGADNRIFKQDDAAATATAYARDIAYDATNKELAIVGKELEFEAGSPSMIVYDVPTGASKIAFKPAADGTNENVDEWHRIQAGASPRSYRLSRSIASAGSNNFISLSLDANNSYSRTYNWNVEVDNKDQDYPLPIDTIDQDASDINRSRDVRLLAVAGGLVKRINPEDKNVEEIAGQSTGPQFSTIRPQVFSARSYPNIYFADGDANRYYDSATNELKTWAGTVGGNEIPSNAGSYCRLICEWGARIVLSGLEAEPQAWFMSAINDPENFNYAEGFETSAVAGSTLISSGSPAGETPDIINALVPWSNDVILFGCDHSIIALSGNPAGGGRADTVTQITGMAFGRPYAFNPDRSLWFIGSRGGLYRMASPTAPPERVSSTTVDDRLTNIDFSSTIVRMAWDDRLQGLLIFFASIEGGSEDQHYFFDARTGGWFPWKFTDADHSPTILHTFDGDSPSDRTILYGCPDGFIRQMDYEGASDDGVAISSHVLIGPIRNPNGVPVVMTGLTGILGKESSNVTYSIHPGDSAEEASRAASIGGGTFGAGRNTWDRRRTSAAALYIKLANLTLDQTWSIERLTASLRTTSRTFEKAH